MIEFPLPTWTSPFVGVVIGEAIGYAIWHWRGRPEMWAQTSVCLWPLRAYDRWRERREQAWLPIHVWAPVDDGGVSDYWRIAGYKDAPGLRCRSQVPDMVQRWLLRDIKALGAQGAWDKHRLQTVTQMARAATAVPRSAVTSSTQTISSRLPHTATFDDVKALLGFAPGDTSADGYVPRVMGMDVTEAAASIAAAMVLPHAGILQQEWRDKRARGGPFQYVSSAVTGSGAAQRQTTVTPNLGMLGATSRPPDPVSDPYLATNDLVERMRDHLGITQAAVAALDVRSFMLFVAIEAAKKDGEEYDDLDAALHEAAGVAKA